MINRRKMKKHFLIDITDHALSVRRDADAITTEAALDGIYIIRTSLSHRTWRLETVCGPTRR